MKKLKKHLEECITPVWNYAKRCHTKQDELCNAIMGLAGESGEIVDQVKKMLWHTEKPYEFHRSKLVQEYGDLLFYTIKSMDLLGITPEECLEANKEKLESRHPELNKVKERFAEGYIK